MLELLLVDPDPIGRTLTRYLIQQQYGSEIQINELPNGYEALDYVKRDSKPDIVLMPIDMPDLNGVDAAIEMRSKGYSGPIILWTKKEELLHDFQVADPVNFLMELESANSRRVLEVLGNYISKNRKLIS